GRFEYSQQFCDALAELVSKCVGSEFKIIAPFASLHKHEVMAAYLRDQTLFSNTWSCKKGVNPQCGECSACIARRTATRLIGLSDTTIYQTSNITWPFPDDKIANPGQISDEQFGKVFG